MKILLISGHARNGKDTLGLILKEVLQNNGKKVLITHYADPLKFYCKSFFHWDGVKDDYGRTLIQKVGTDLVRSKHPDYWANSVLYLLDALQDEWDYVIIPDCRFKNEIIKAKEMFPGSIHIRIERNIENGLTETQNNHISETELNDFPVDYMFMNTGTLENLKEKAHEWVSENLS